MVRAKLFLIQALLTTVCAMILAWFAVASIRVGGLLSSNWMAADVIRQQCPLHLVSPNWISGAEQADVLSGWYVTELRTRLDLVLAVWMIALSTFAWRLLRGPNNEHLERSAECES
jgi:hypothetical protein